MYVAVKGGDRAIAAAHAELARERRGDPDVGELAVAQIREQLSLAVSRVMAEGSCFDPDLAALAIKQARGDLIEAIFLLRAYRTTLPRFAVSVPLDTSQMRPVRRISAVFKDIPGGQVLGPTFDYTHRLLDFTLADATDPDHRPASAAALPPEPAERAGLEPMPRVVDLLNEEGLLEKDVDDGARPGDLTREALKLPCGRSVRLQSLARGDEGFLLALGYSTQRGYGTTHPFAGEIRVGTVEVSIAPEDLGFPVVIGEIDVTECQMVNQFHGNKDHPPQFTQGYGLVLGHAERKAMSMALVDRAMRAAELGERIRAPAQDQEFVLAHADNVQATGFVEHLKLPHYVDFQSELEILRSLRAARGGDEAAPTPPEPTETTTLRGLDD